MVACIYTTGLGSFEHIVYYGASTSGGTTPGGSGYKWTNGIISFSSTNLIFTKTEASNYVNSFSYACNALTITKIRVSNVRAYSTYQLSAASAYVLMYRLT